MSLDAGMRPGKILHTMYCTAQVFPIHAHVSDVVTLLILNSSIMLEYSTHVSQL